MCGIFAYYEPKGYPAGEDGLAEVVTGLVGQLNRGQEGVGIAAFSPEKEEVFRLEKTDLSIDRVINDPEIFQKFQKLNGSVILGHNRYATHGSISNIHAQPMQNDPKGLLPKARRKAIIFNGNIANELALRTELELKGYVFETDTDTEVLLSLITDIDNQLHGAVSSTISDYTKIFQLLDKKIDGACSLVLMDACGDMVFYRDKNGIRPLVFSKLGDGRIVAASETSALEAYEGEIQTLQPGNIFWFNRSEGRGNLIEVTKQNLHFCSNEILYLGRPESEIGGQSLYSIRYKIGGALAEIAKDKLKGLTEEEKQTILITPVPNTGIPYGVGMAEGLGLPYNLALTVHNLRRSFINAADSREKILKDKHAPIKDLVEGKIVWCVDDTIIRSSTARVITEKLFHAGAARVEWFVGAPMFKGTCHYGLSVPSLQDLAYWKAHSLLEAERGNANNDEDIEKEIANLVGADDVTFLTTDKILNAFPSLKGNFCMACFDLKYPSPEGRKLFDLERSAIKLTVNENRM